MPFAEQRLNSFLREMAMPCAHVHHERIGSARTARQWSAKPLINGLSNEVLDDRAVQSGSHNLSVIFAHLRKVSTIFLHFLSKSSKT